MGSARGEASRALRRLAMMLGADISRDARFPPRSLSFLHAAAEGEPRRSSLDRGARYRGSGSGPSGDDQSQSHEIFGLGEILFGRQIAPLARRQVTQHDIADTHTLQSDDMKTDQFAHAADLPLSAFLQDEAQLIGVLPHDLGRLERLVVQAQTVAE